MSKSKRREEGVPMKGRGSSKPVLESEEKSSGKRAGPSPERGPFARRVTEEVRLTWLFILLRGERKATTTTGGGEEGKRQRAGLLSEASFTRRNKGRKRKRDRAVTTSASSGIYIGKKGRAYLLKRQCRREGEGGRTDGRRREDHD